MEGAYPRCKIFLTPLILFFGWSFLSLFWARNFSLASHQFLLIAQALVLAGLILFFLKKKIFTSRQFLWLVVGISVFEATVGFLQIIFQNSVGLYFLGEPHLDILNPQVAKTLVWGGGRLLRAYGTFVHPNILGMFLGLGLTAFLHLISNIRKDIGYWILDIGILFTLLLGLALTFSRSAWLVFGLVFLFYSIKNKSYDLLMTVVIIATFLFFALHPFILPKIFISPIEPSVALRIDYIKSGWELLKDHPLIGAGIGNSILYTKQPVHNLYLLILAETGFIGLALFLFFIISPFKHLLEIRNSKLKITILTAVLLLGLFDHYFWTIPAGLLIFFSIVLLSTAPKCYN